MMALMDGQVDHKINIAYTGPRGLLHRGLVLKGEGDFHPIIIWCVVWYGMVSW